MLRKKFQGGSYFEVFNVLEKNPTENWKLSSSSIKKIYDKHAKGFVLCLSGNGIITWMQLPPDLKHGLGLLQSLLVFQLILWNCKDFSLEISVSLDDGCRKRIIISTLQKKVHVTPLLVQIPFIWKRKDKWLHLCLDLEDLVSGLWNGQIFSSVECITLRASCQLKRIFTLNKSHIYLSSDNDAWKEQLLCYFPSQFLMHGVYDVCIVDTTHIENIKQLNLSKTGDNLPFHKKSTDAESKEEKDGSSKQNVLMDSKQKSCHNSLCHHKSLCKLSQSTITNKKREGMKYSMKKLETNSSQSRTSLFEDPTILESYNDTEGLYGDNDVSDNHLLTMDDNDKNQNTPMQPSDDILKENRSNLKYPLFHISSLDDRKQTKCSEDENYASNHVAGYTEQLACSSDYKVQINIFHTVSCKTEKDLISRNNRSKLDKKCANVINGNHERKSMLKPKSDIVHFKTNTKQVRYNPVVQHDGGTYICEEKECQVKAVFTKVYDKNKYASDNTGADENISSHLQQETEIESTSLANELQTTMLSVQSQHQKLYEADEKSTSLESTLAKDVGKFNSYPKIYGSRKGLQKLPSKETSNLKENDENDVSANIKSSLELKNTKYLDTVKKNEKIYNPLIYTTNDVTDYKEIKAAADLKERRQYEISQPKANDVRKTSHLIYERQECGNSEEELVMAVKEMEMERQTYFPIRQEMTRVALPPLSVLQNSSHWRMFGNEKTSNKWYSNYTHEKDGEVVT